MKLATRTALIYTTFTAIILLLFASVVILVSKKNQKDEFFDRLGYKLTWRAEFYFDAHVQEDVIRFLHVRNQQVLNEADVSIYNSTHQLIFSDLQKPINIPWVWERLKHSEKVKWTSEDWQYMAVSYWHKNQKYYIFGRAKDVTGSFYMNRLQDNVVLIYIASLVVIFCISFLFSNYTLKPLKEIINQIRDISEHRLHHRLNIPKAKDELYELTETFNSTFNRLEKSFNTHKSFVTTISHEFRTPLSALIAELQLAKELNVSIDDYKNSIDNALDDAQKATQLSSALLDLARASYDVSQISFVSLRIDEVLMEAKLSIFSKNPEYQVKINFDFETNSDDSVNLDFVGNPYLLMIAFTNLMENACKYSTDKSCEVLFQVTDNFFLFKFIDHGFGIPEEDQKKIFDLFYRGTNKDQNKGNGIGLSIVNQIVNLHQGELKLISEVGVGSTFELKFRKDFNNPN